MGDYSKRKSAARTSSWSLPRAGNVSSGNQLQASPSPMTNAKDASSWLETKGWILTSKNYTKPKLADILFTVALTQKLPSDVSATIKAVTLLIEDFADHDLSDSLALLITDKVTLQISSSIDNMATEVAATKGFFGHSCTTASGGHHHTERDHI